MSDRDKLVLSEIEQSELTKNDPIPAGVVGVRKNQTEPAVVLSVRIPVEMREQIEQLAGKLEVPTTALVRGFIAEGLAARGQLTVHAMVRKLEADAGILRKLLG